jgi:hypothetical protein
LCHSNAPSISKAFLAAGLLYKLDGGNFRRRSDDSPFPTKKWQLAGRNNSTTVLFGHLPTEELSRRKKQYCTEKRNQNPPGVCLGNRRNARVPLVGLPILIAIVYAAIAFTVIRAGIRQRRENQSGSY